MSQVTTRSPRLYELATELIDIEAALVEAGGELTPETEAKLDALHGELAVKTEGICKLVATLASEAEMCDREANRLLSLAKVRRNAVDRIKHYVLNSFQAAGIKRVGNSLFSVYVQRNSQPSIRCTCDPKDLPTAFRRETVTYDVDREAVKRTPASELPDCIVVEHNSHLRIR